MSDLKLYMLVLGCKPPGRHTEQHDIFFGIATSLKELVPEIEKFWSDAGRIHIDAWREVNWVDGFRVNIQSKKKKKGDGTRKKEDVVAGHKLFFINLGGYQPDKLEEQHYTLVTARPDKTAAFSEAKDSLFFRDNHFPGAESHIDDKYGIDVDDLYQIDDILPSSQKKKFDIELIASDEPVRDEIHLGYLKISSLKK